MRCAACVHSADEQQEEVSADVDEADIDMLKEETDAATALVPALQLELASHLGASELAAKLESAAISNELLRAENERLQGLASGAEYHQNEAARFAGLLRDSEARLAAMESRSAAAISDVRNQTSEALEALERRVDEGLARNAATQSAALDAITMSLMDMEGRLEASSKASST